MYPFICQLVIMAMIPVGYLHSWERAAPAYGIVTGLHLSLLGVLLLLQLPEKKELEIVVNGRQVTKVPALWCSVVQVASTLPLRAVAFTVTIADPSDTSSAGPPAFAGQMLDRHVEQVWEKWQDVDASRMHCVRLNKRRGAAASRLQQRGRPGDL